MPEPDQCTQIRRTISVLNERLPRLGEEMRQTHNAVQALRVQIEDARYDLRQLEVVEVLANGLPAGRVALAIVRALGAANLSAAKDVLRQRNDRLNRTLRQTERRLSDLDFQIEQDETNRTISAVAFEREGCS